jgi:hypothetical protein
MNRFTAAHDIAFAVCSYLSEAGWTTDDNCIAVDPTTKCRHGVMTAFQIQFERDRQGIKELNSSIFLIE